MSIKYGYCRVNETDSNFQKEMESLRLVGCKKIVYDIIPSYRRYGNNFLQLIQDGKKGDFLIVYSFARLCNTLAELSTICAYMVDSRMELISLKEQINSTTLEGALFMRSMSEASVDLLENEENKTLELKF